MNHRSYIGQLGENIACGYLVKNKYKIVERNFRQKWGEIDIIAKAPDKTLVFVEVKTVRGVKQLHIENGADASVGIPTYRRDDKHISAEDQLTAAKLQKLQRTASLYAGHNQDLVDDKKGWRIDLMALTLIDNHYVIKHYKNI